MFMKITIVYYVYTIFMFINIVYHNIVYYVYNHKHSINIVYYVYGYFFRIDDLLKKRKTIANNINFELVPKMQE